MAGRGKGYSKNSKFQSDVTFSDIRLTAEDKKKFRALSPDERSALVEDVFKMVANDHKLSVSYVESSNSYIASLTCKAENRPNYNVCLTNYADNAWDAIALAAYKTRYCCADGIWSAGEDDDLR